MGLLGYYGFYGENRHTVIEYPRYQDEFELL